MNKKIAKDLVNLVNDSDSVYDAQEAVEEYLQYYIIEKKKEVSYLKIKSDDNTKKC